jgi:NAD(P)-dependent dehydrogenase (short-subunit alcohol dehydrogenase family)
MATPELAAAQDVLSSRGLVKTRVITGADPRIGARLPSRLRESAGVLTAYLGEHEDANETKGLVEQSGARCVLLSSDVSDSKSALAVATRRSPTH